MPPRRVSLTAHKVLHMDKLSALDIAAGAEIRAARARLGWSQQKFAEESGISFGSLRRYEAGERSMKVEQMDRLCRVLGIQLAEVLDAIAAAGEQQ